VIVDPFEGNGAAYTLTISMGSSPTPNPDPNPEPNPEPEPQPDPPCIPAGGCGTGAPSCLLAMAAGLLGARPAIRRRRR
jgi:hypothetical protein